MDPVEQENDNASLHPIFTRDPSDWMKLIGCQIQACTEDGHQHVGHVYTVDPVSQSIVLVSFGDNAPETSCNISLKLLVGSSVTDVKIVSEAVEAVNQRFHRLFRPAVAETLSGEQMSVRKLRLKSWLEKNRLPVSLGGDSGQLLLVADAITVQPPYTEDSCLSTNEIVLSRIQGLIKNMPPEESLQQ